MDYSAYKCICAGTEPVEVWRRTLYKCDPDYEFCLLACGNWGLGMLWPPLTEQEKARVSGRTQTGRLHRPGSGQRFAIAHVRDASKGLLCKLVPSELPAGASVLGVGCGAGDLASALAQKGFQVTGLDPAPAAADDLAGCGGAHPRPPAPPPVAVLRPSSVHLAQAPRPARSDLLRRPPR